MFFVCWRARLKALPVDETIKGLGVPIVSKCECCVVPKVETLDHVLCDGEEARNVWNYFVAIFSVRLPRVRL